MVHEVSSVSLDLLVGGDGTEDDLGEALAGEHPETDAADRTPVLDEGQRLVLRVEDEPVAKKKFSHKMVSHQNGSMREKLCLCCTCKDATNPVTIPGGNKH